MHNGEQARVAICVSCGAAQKRGEPSCVTIREEDVDGLVRLFERFYDFERCHACSVRRPHASAIIVRLSDGRELRCFGDAGGSGAAPLGPGDGGVEYFESADDLRAAVAGALSESFERLNELTRAYLRNDLRAHVGCNWSAYTARVFRAAQLVARVPIVAVRLVAEDGTGCVQGKVATPANVKVWALAQSMVWQDLLGAELSDESRVFEEDLGSFVQPRSVLDEAIGEFEFFLPQPELGRLLADYVGHAMSAGACVAAGVENPRQIDWAHLYFQFEAELVGGAPADWERLRISEVRARSTLTKSHAWDAISLLLQQKRDLRLLQSLAERAGYPQLVGEIIRESARLPADAPLTFLKDLLTADLGRRDVALYITIGDIEALVDGLVRADRIADAEELVAFARTAATHPDDRAAVAIAASRRLDRGRGRLLDALAGLGEQSREWEGHASDEAVALLWAERSLTLRGLARIGEATNWAYAAYERAGFNVAGVLGPVYSALALALREAGQPDEAVEGLARLGESAQPNWVERERLEHLAATYARLGRLGQALDQIDIAWREHEQAMPARLWALGAWLLARQGRTGQATQVLRSRAPGVRDRRELTLFTVRAWVELLERGAVSAPEVRPLEAELDDVIRIASEAGDRLLALEARHVRARLIEATEPERAEQAWQDAADAREGLVPQEPVELASLARFAYDHGDLGGARLALSRIPFALAQAYGKVRDLGVVAPATAKLGESLRRVGRVVVSEGEATDIRLAGELQRDAINRARTTWRQFVAGEEHPPPLAAQLHSSSLAALAPDTSALGVIEWLHVGSGINCFFTRIAKSEVSARVINPPDAAQPRLVAPRLRERLASWRPGAAGDPLDYPDWRVWEAWLLGEVGKELDAGDHLVIFEHGSLTGLPWHASRAAPWTCSYATGWSDLISLHAGPRPALRRFGLVCVPRAFDSATVLREFDESSQRSRDLAKRNNLDLDEVEGGSYQTDATAVKAMLEEVDMLKVLCHGFVSRKEQDTAFMLAHGGELPLANSVAADRAEGRRHRFGWRECSQISRAPSIVWSAGCSTGSQHPVGLGDRLGALSALRFAGTRSVVAPRWDVVAEEVVPVVDESIRRYVERSGTMATALRDACAAAAASQHSAWSLALEGDWR